MQQKVLILLGMHRSGTSLVARLVNLLGVYLGNRLMDPAPDNPKGYWEHDDIWRIHERLLQSLGEREWHTALPLPDQWWLDANVRLFRDELLSVLTRDFCDCPFWGIKDPRLSRLLPLWKIILAHMGCQPYFLHVIRNPCEVAASLERRDGFTSYKSILLWFYHVTEAEVQTRGFPRAFVTFSQVLLDWESAANRIARELRIQWPIDPDRVRCEVDTFIEGTLRHHSEPDEAFLQRPEIPSFVTEAYRGLMKAAQEPGYDVTEDLSRSSLKYNDEIRRCFPLLGIAADLQARSPAHFLRVIAEKHVEIALSDALISGKNDALKRVLASTSWGMSALLRAIGRHIRGS